MKVVGHLPKELYRTLNRSLFICITIRKAVTHEQVIRCLPSKY